MSSLISQTHEVCVCACVCEGACLCVGAGMDHSQQTLKQSRLLSACRIASLNPHSLFCLLLVSVFYSFQYSHNPSFKKLSLADGDRGLYADSSCLHFRSSGTCEAWTWMRRWRLSTPCRKGPWHSHSAGRFPSRESLSSSAWCTPLPASAPACRFWSRNGGHSSSPPSNQTNAGKGRPRALTEVDKISGADNTSLNNASSWHMSA